MIRENVKSSHAGPLSRQVTRSSTTSSSELSSLSFFFSNVTDTPSLCRGYTIAVPVRKCRSCARLEPLPQEVVVGFWTRVGLRFGGTCVESPLLPLLFTSYLALLSYRNQTRTTVTPALVRLHAPRPELSSPPPLASSLRGVRPALHRRDSYLDTAARLPEVAT